MTGKSIRSKRKAAEIPGYAVCQLLPGISRGRLSEIEREYISPSAEDLQRIDSAIDQIIRTRKSLARLASEAGLSLAGVRL